MITFIFPLFNREEDFIKNLNRIIPQLNEQCELLILDNASGFDVRSIVQTQIGEKCKFKYRVVINRVNIGAEANVLRCFELCESDWLFIVGVSRLVSLNLVEIVFNDVKRYPSAGTVNYHLPSLQHSIREKTVVCTGVGEFIENMGSFGNMILIGNTLYSSKIVNYIDIAYLYTFSHAPQFSIILASLNEDTISVFSHQQVISQTLKKPPQEKKNITMIECWTGFSVLMDLVDDIPMRKKLGSNVNGYSGLEHESVLVFLKVLVMNLSITKNKDQAKYLLYRATSLRYYYSIKFQDKALLMVAKVLIRSLLLTRLIIHFNKFIK